MIYLPYHDTSAFYAKLHHNIPWYHTIPLSHSTLFVQVGTVWCNCWLLRDLNVPFGGIKASGLGSEGNFESLEFYTNTKTVCVKY